MTLQHWVPKSAFPSSQLGGMRVPLSSSQASTQAVFPRKFIWSTPLPACVTGVCFEVWTQLQHQPRTAEEGPWAQEEAEILRRHTSRPTPPSRLPGHTMPRLGMLCAPTDKSFEIGTQTLFLASQGPGQEDTWRGTFWWEGVTQGAGEYLVLL
jgi:hypothetical protein